MNNHTIVEIGGSVNGSFKRNILCNLKDVREELNKYSFVDKYTTVYRYANTNQDLSTVVAPLYLDLDMDNIEENYDKLKRDLHLIYRQLKRILYLEDKDIDIYFSGSKGFHIMINEKVLRLEPDKALNESYKIFALRLKSFTLYKTIDTKIYDKKRLFRVPNTINSKTGLYKVPISLKQLNEFDYNDLVEWAKEPKPIKPKIYMHNKKAQDAFVQYIKTIKEEESKKINHKVAREMLEKKELLPCIKYILQNGATKGQRNNIANTLASALLQCGKPLDETLDVMHSWNIKKNSPPLPDKEIVITTNSAYKNFNAGRKYGCSSFKMLGVCVKGCPVHK